MPPLQPPDSPMPATEAVAAAFLAKSDEQLRRTIHGMLDDCRADDILFPPLLSWAEIQLYRDGVSSPARIHSVFPALLARHQALAARTECGDTGLHGLAPDTPSLTQTALLALDAIQLSLMAHALRMIRPEIELRTEHISLHDAANAACWDSRAGAYTETAALPWLLIARIATPERAMRLFPENAPAAAATPLPPAGACIPLLEGLRAFRFQPQADALLARIRETLASPADADAFCKDAPFARRYLEARLSEAARPG